MVTPRYLMDSDVVSEPTRPAQSARALGMLTARWAAMPV